MTDRPVPPRLVVHYGRFLLAGLLWTLSLWLFALGMALLALRGDRPAAPWRLIVIWLPAVAGTYAVYAPGRRPRLQRLMLAVLLTAVVVAAAGTAAALASRLLTPALSGNGGVVGALWMGLVQMGVALASRYAGYPPGRSWLLEVLISMAIVFLPELVAMPWLAVPAGLGVWVVAAWGSAEYET
ncbi:MAG: hypothetical protein ACM3ZA_07735 [Bacillota bacterium]